MPLLVVALITHVIYKAMTQGWDWGTAASRKAWDASMAGSGRAADKLRQKFSDKLGDWAASSGARGYAAYGLRAAGLTARGLGKAGVWTALKGARATGAVVRALGGGALATGGMLGALAQATRDGVHDGAEWWKRRAKNPSDRAQGYADRASNWGKTFPGSFTVDSEEPIRPGPQPDQGAGPKAEQPFTDHGTTFTDPPGGDPPPEPEGPREAFDAGEATVGDPVDTRPPAPPTPIDAEPYEYDPYDGPISDEDKRTIKWHLLGEEDPPDAPPRTQEPAAPPPYWAGEASTLGPTPVGSTTAGGSAVGTATAVIDPPETQALEGEIVTTLVPVAAGTNAVAPLSTPADGMQYEQALLFLNEQAKRARELAELVEQVNLLQRKVQEGARVLLGDNQVAEDALARFRVKTPGLTVSSELLAEVAGDPAPDNALIAAYMALDAVVSSCHAAAADLVQRFGHAWEVMSSENADGSFLNN